MPSTHWNSRLLVGDMYNMQQQSAQMMQHQHQHQHQQQLQQQQQNNNQTGSHMRTAQAAASQYPMGYPYNAGAMDNGQGLAQGQPMVGGDMQHFNMQQNPAGGVTTAQRQMINVAQLNPMLAGGDANGSTGQPGDISPSSLSFSSILPPTLVLYCHQYHSIITLIIIGILHLSPS